MTRTGTTLLVLLMLAPALCEATQAEEQREGTRRGRPVEIVVPAPDAIQQLDLKDGSRLYGRVERIDDDSFVFRTLAGVEMTVRRADVVALGPARGRVVNGEFWPEDSTVTRLFFAPTARALRRGEGYVGVYEFMLPFVQVGLTDRISIGGGAPLFLGGGGGLPFWFTPKIQLYSRRDTAVSAGLLHIGNPDDGSMGIAYGVGTWGRSDNAVTVGLGYGYLRESNGDRSGAAIVMIGGERRVTRRTKFVTENWLWRGGNGFLSGGVRFLGDRLTADLALAVPVDRGGPLFAFPLVNFVWRF